MGNNPVGDFFGDPLNSVQTATSGLPALMALMERYRQRNDPRMNELFNTSIDRYNAGPPMGEMRDGYGGAFGHDSSGNPLSPVAAHNRYLAGQMGGGQMNLDRAFEGFGGLGGHTAGMMGGGGPRPGGGGAPAPGGTMPGGGGGGYTPQLDLQLDPMGSNSYDPTAVRGTDPAGLERRTIPTRQTPSDQREGFFARLFGGLPQFDTGITNVPQDMVAKVHQGEMIVPAAQNPMANTVPQPMAPPGGGGGLPSPPPSPTPPAAGTPGNGGYYAMNPGISQQSQDGMVNQARNDLDRGYQEQARQMRAQGGATGRINSGNLERNLFDADMSRRQGLADTRTNVSLAADERRFGDTLAANQFELSRSLGEGGLALDRDRFGLESELGRGQLGLARDQFGLDRELGRGQLDLSNRDLALRDYLGRSQMGLARDQFGLDRTLGLGGLDLQRREFGLNSDIQRGRLSLDRTLGLGDQDLRRLGLDNDYRLGNRNLDVQRELELGSQGLRGREIDNDYRLGNRGLDLGNRNLDFDIGRHQDEFGRSTYLDQLGFFQQQQSRNDQLSREAAEFGIGAEQMDFERLIQLLGLSGQFA